ncbi:MAG TPA: class I SAM-dependent methyltransferase [Bacilli bacterium]|nr:class I SAM-dependent methyltransferase [Bacilli bacterium]
MSMQLPSRLMAIASHINEKDHVADIGSDHGLLPLFLVKESHLTRVYASDNKEGPFKILHKAVTEANLADQIQVDLADGLKKLPEDIDTVVISGMGGDVICDIINDSIDKLDQIKKIILVPHTKADEVRSLMAFYGFSFEDEVVVEEDNHFYEIIVMVPKRHIYCGLELVFGPINLNQKSDSFIRMWRDRYERNEKILSGNIDDHRRDQILAEQEKIETLWSKQKF